MINITTIYNAFSGTLRFLINNRPVPDISRLSQFQKRPFADWCTQIFPIAFDEINDDYVMTYVGRGCEARMLAYYARENNHCRGFLTKIPVIADSALKRLKKLHMLCMNGLMYQKFTKEITVCSDLPQEEVQRLFKQALPRLCYCIFRVSCYPLAACADQKAPFYALVSEGSGGTVPQIIRECPSECHLIRISDHTGFSGIAEGCFLDDARREDVGMILQEKLEFVLFPEILRKAMRGISLTESHPQYYAFAALDKTEPVTVPAFPLSMEFGQQKPIELRTIPEGYPQDKLSYRVSSEEILTIKDNVINAVGSGEAVVEAYLPGQTVRVAVAHIKVVRRNRITSIKTEPAELELCVGETSRFKYSYQPEDADNSSTIKLASVDGTVASVKANGEVLARKPGSTSIFAETDNHIKGICRVRVYPALEEIKVLLQKDTIRCGEYASVETRRIPEAATLYPLIFRVEPVEIAEYDAGSKIIVTKKPGKAVLCVTDSRRSAETRIPFTVKKKGLFR